MRGALEYLSPGRKDKYLVAQANVELDEKGRWFPDWSTRARRATSC